MPLENEPKKVAQMTPEIMNMLGKCMELTLPEKMGFALLIFDFTGDDKEVKYVSNAQRPDMFKALKDIISKWETDAVSRN